MDAPETIATLTGIMAGVVVVVVVVDLLGVATKM